MSKLKVFIITDKNEGTVRVTGQRLETQIIRIDNAKLIEV